MGPPTSYGVDGRIFLLNELAARQNRNSAYSLRAFSRDIGVSPTALSLYLRRKRTLSKKNFAKIADKMNLSPNEKNLFGIARRGKSAVESDLIAEDEFKLICDWTSLAILNLAKLKANRASPGWVAKRLNIPKEKANETLQRLFHLKYLEVKNGRLARIKKDMRTTTDIPSEAIVRYHLSLIQKAQDSLLNLKPEERDITAMTMPADPKKFAKAKEIIRSTHHRVSKLLDGDEASEVFVLAIQLFPLTGNEPHDQEES